ncbi:MAG: DMT family transporter [Alphaproteobacteria bacterium]
MTNENVGANPKKHELRVNRPVLGASLMILGMLVFPVGDAVAKHLSSHYSTLGLSWFRFSIGAIFLLPFALRTILKGMPVSKPMIAEQSLRGLLVLGATVFFVAALARIPLADTVGAYAIAPIIASLLAVVVLKESLSNRKIFAVVLGFCGTLLIVRPGVSMDVGFVYALLAGACFGGFLVANRWAKTDVPPYFAIAFQTWFGLLVLLPFVLSDLANIRSEDLALLLLMGAGSATAQVLTIIAARMTSAGLLAPLVYFEMIGAVILGYWVFGDVPAFLTWIGMAVVVVAGLLLIKRRNMRR